VHAKVRTRDVYIEIRGLIPGELLRVLRQEYGYRLLISAGGFTPMRDVLFAPLYDSKPRLMKAGDFVRFYRCQRGLSQTGLARELGGIPRQNVSAMERGTRPVGKGMAARLAVVFGVPPCRFLEPGGPRPPAGLSSR
jgi:hypothetical protein